jgi:hypothetical protein
MTRQSCNNRKTILPWMRLRPPLIFQTLFIGLLAAGCVSTPIRPTSYPVTGQTPYPITEGPLTIASTTSSLGITPTVTATPSVAWISLSPDSGGPGTTVRIDGYLPGGLPEDELKNDDYLTHADVCWGGCQNGLVESGLDVTWSAQAPDHFSSQFVVPEIPWLAADGLHPLKAGDYPVDIPYLDPNATGCSQSIASKESCPVTPQVSATFHLTEGYRGSECQDASSCGYLRVTSEEGAPGDKIQVQGWAPLLQLIGQPFGYDLVLETQGGTSSQNLIYLDTVQQEMDGSLTASFQVPQYGYDGAALSPGSYTLALRASGLTSGKNTPAVLVAPTAFEISAAPVWTARQRTAPLWIQPSASLDSALSLDALDPNRLAYCVDGAIRVSRDGGQSWASIPTSPVNELALPDDLVMDNSQPACTSVLLNASHPDSFYAVFGAKDKQYGIPPIYYLPFYTTDRGKTWQLVPVQAVQTSSPLVEGRFGGFWTDGKAVQALYLGETGGSNQAPSLLVKQTMNGGATWEQASLTCPPSGPCLRWGPAPGEISGMGADLLQDVMASFDQGRTWSSTGETVDVRLPGPHELVALSQDEALVISGNAHYPLRYTSDSGRTWQALALPSLPIAHPSWPYGFPGLQMFPDGSLLVMDPDTGQWWTLPPNARDRCPLEITSPDKYPVLLQSAAGRVWWLSAMTGEPESAPASSFVCAP